MRADYIDHMGDDLRVVNAARVSFNKESFLETFTSGSGDRQKVWQELQNSDKKLLGYLSRHGHWTPFSHPQITLRETVPIFVARQRFKYMIGFAYNEVSRRYVDDTPEFFVPDVWRARPDTSIKQGSGDEVIGFLDMEDQHSHVNEMYDDHIEKVMGLYKRLIAGNVAPEQARMVLPQSMYTSYYVTGSLAAWARAYKLRIDPHAQKEIQDLAAEWGGIIQPLYPVSWEALTTGEAK